MSNVAAVSRLIRLEAELTQLRAENEWLREHNKRIFEEFNNIIDRLLELVPPNAGGRYDQN